MKTCRGLTESLGRAILILAGLLLLAPAGPAWAVGALTVADVVAFSPANTCAGGIATIGAVTPIGNGADLDFIAAGCPTVNVTAAGALQLEDLSIPQVTGKSAFNGCLTGGVALGSPPPGTGSPEMHILAGDLTILGSINGDVGGPVNGGQATNGGFIDILLLKDGALTGSLKVLNGGRISSNRGVGGSGKGGDIVVKAEGLIDVQLGGLIQSNSGAETVGVYKAGCGQTQIILQTPPLPPIDPAFLPLPAGHPDTSGPNDITIAGTVEIINGTTVGLGGIILLEGGHPPDSVSGHVKVTTSGLVRVGCSDEGGCHIIIKACFVDIVGSVRIGFPETGLAPGSVVQTEFGREGSGFSLAMIIDITANETAVIHPDPGQILGVDRGVLAIVREGFKAHKGQATLPGGDPCDYAPLTPANTNGPNLAFKPDGTSLGGADVCVKAGGGVTIVGPVGGNDFAVESNNRGGSQKGGSVFVLTTREGASPGTIEMSGNAITASMVPPGSGLGGQIHIQGADDVDFEPGGVNGAIVKAQGAGAGTVGGRIQVQAVGPLAGGAGEIKGASGALTATGPGGSLANAIQFAECVVNAANNPAATPAATALAGAACGVPQVFTGVLTLAPCAPGCFCIERLKVNATSLVITGQDMKGVTEVEINSTTCDPFSGIPAGNGTVVAGCTKNAARTVITCTPFATPLVPGKKLVLFGTAAPSSSCAVQP